MKEGVYSQDWDEKVGEKFGEHAEMVHGIHSVGLGLISNRHSSGVRCAHLFMNHSATRRLC